MNANVRLGINVDHVATLREARGEVYPDPAEAAELALKAGADQITIHLREDRRHIQDSDVAPIQKICQQHNKLFNFEMGCTNEMIELAATIKPHWVCLVPEKRQEQTTEGGLDLIASDNFQRVRAGMMSLRQQSPQTRISLFVESDLATLARAKELQADAVEIHTGDFAHKFNNNLSYQKDIDGFLSAYEFLKKNEIGHHAGHGLTDKSLYVLLKLNIFTEYNIGHWVIATAVTRGLDTVVSQLKDMMKEFQ